MFERPAVDVDDGSTACLGSSSHVDGIPVAHFRSPRRRRPRSQLVGPTADRPHHRQHGSKCISSRRWSVRGEHIAQGHIDIADGLHDVIVGLLTVVAGSSSSKGSHVASMVEYSCFCFHSCCFSYWWRELVIGLCTLLGGAWMSCLPGGWPAIALGSPGCTTCSLHVASHICVALLVML